MKRIFAAAAALALVCILTACGTGSPAPEGGTTTPMDENKAAGTVTIPVPEETGDTPDDTLGALTGGTYTNKTARITCTLDDSWLFYNERQLEELNGVLTEAGGGDVASLAESGKAVYDMYAVSTDGLMTMNVTYQNLGLLSGASMTAQEYVEWAAQTLPGDLAACGLTDVEVQITAQDLAAERERIAKELEKAKNGLRITEGKLANEKFVAHAPENVVNAEREKVAKYQELIAKLEESAKAMA